MVSEISNVFGPGSFTVHHKIKWSVMWRLIWCTQKQDVLELNIKKALMSVIERDSDESHPNY